MLNKIKKNKKVLPISEIIDKIKKQLVEGKPANEPTGLITGSVIDSNKFFYQSQNLEKKIKVKF